MKFILKSFVILIVLVIGFNRLAPFLIGNDTTSSSVEKSEDGDSIGKAIELLKGNVLISARLVEHGRWIVLVEEDEIVLSKAFAEQGISTGKPEFDLYIKEKMVNEIPDIDFEKSLIKIDSFQDMFEIHVKGRDVVSSLMQIFKVLYKSKENVMEDVALFKAGVKRCINEKLESDKYICKYLRENPLPKPEPVILYINEDGEDVPMKGFSECYFRVLKEYKGEVTAEVSEAAKEECYSEW